MNPTRQEVNWDDVVKARERIRKTKLDPTEIYNTTAEEIRRLVGEDGRHDKAPVEQQIAVECYLWNSHLRQEKAERLARNKEEREAGVTQPYLDETNDVDVQPTLPLPRTITKPEINETRERVRSMQRAAQQYVRDWAHAQGLDNTHEGVESHSAIVTFERTGSRSIVLFCQNGEPGGNWTYTPGLYFISPLDGYLSGKLIFAAKGRTSVTVEENEEFAKIVFGIGEHQKRTGLLYPQGRTGWNISQAEEIFTWLWKEINQGQTVRWWTDNDYTMSIPSAGRDAWDKFVELRKEHQGYEPPTIIIHAAGGQALTTTREQNNDNRKEQ